MNQARSASSNSLERHVCLASAMDRELRGQQPLGFCMNRRIADSGDRARGAECRDIDSEAGEGLRDLHADGAQPDDRHAGR